MSDTRFPPELLRPNRRRFLGNAAATAAGVAMAATAMRPDRADAATAVTDVDILNFALNLEYLEAEYYLRGVYGTGLTASETSGKGTFGGVVSTPTTPKVTFALPATQKYMTEIANDEHDHVLFLRSALGSAAVSEPQIDIGKAFNTLAVAAGLGSSFDPYASETNFILGGFIFEDVGVTAYNGAAPLISNKDYLAAAASILAVEAYHAAELRTLITYITTRGQQGDLITPANAISKLRDSLDGSSNDDQGVYVDNTYNIVPTDANGLVFSRTTTQVLSIVYGNTGAMPGLFFPHGMHGKIR